MSKRKRLSVRMVICLNYIKKKDFERCPSKSRGFKLTTYERNLFSLPKYKLEMRKKIKELTKENCFDDVNYIGMWNGHKVYEPIYTDGTEHDIGYPQYILSKGNSLRWTKNWEESLDIMTTLG